MKKIIWIICCASLYSSQALAVCSSTITASTPTGEFVDNGNGTVTHTKTGLMWKQCAEGLSGAGCATGTSTTFTWQGALNQAKAVNAAGFAGFNDWRVPNQKELGSIVERQCRQPTINSAFFPATVRSLHWSSSPDAATAGNAWRLDFTLGTESQNLKSNSLYVRLVRGGQ